MEKGNPLDFAENRALIPWSSSRYPNRFTRLPLLPCSRQELAVQSSWTRDSHALCRFQGVAFTFHLCRTWRHNCHYHPSQEQDAASVTERDSLSLRVFVMPVSADSKDVFVSSSCWCLQTAKMSSCLRHAGVCRQPSCLRPAGVCRQPSCLRVFVLLVSADSQVVFVSSSCWCLQTAKLSSCLRPAGVCRQPSPFRT
jgi:hypothetical protein